ncbi:MAG: endolytic transglycosylase MltG [Lachnospiraceae bacterium]|nr:endolytic transglycosylase MltG [Lachnospiraceae bacterium]
MSNQKKKKGAKRKKSNAQNVAGGAVSTIFNIVLVVVAVMLIYRFSVSAYQYGVRLFGEPPMSEAPGEEVVVTITDGMDFDGIAEMMVDNGLAREKTLFKIQIYLSNYSEDGFAEGTYTLSTAMTPEELMDAMAGSGEES